MKSCYLGTSLGKVEEMDEVSSETLDVIDVRLLVSFLRRENIWADGRPKQKCSIYSYCHIEKCAYKEDF